MGTEKGTAGTGRVKKVFSVGVRREGVSIGEGEDGGHFVAFVQLREL